MSERRIVILALTALSVCLAAALAVAFFVGTSPARISALAAWGSFITALATLLLFMGAVFAAIVVLSQVREARQSREDALRPVVQLTSAYTDGRLIRVRLKNVGPGPALEVHVFGWERWEEAPEAFDGLVAEYSAFIDAERAGIDRTAGFVDNGISLLAVNEEAEFGLWDPDEPAATQSARGGRLYYRLTYHDVFDRAFDLPDEGTDLPYVHYQYRRRDE